MTPKEQIALFDNFMNGNLSDDEISVFKDRLNSDSKLKKEFDEYQLVVAGIVEQGAKGIKEKLKEREDFHRRERANTKMYYKIAAAMLLLLVASFLLLRSSFSPDPQSVYLAYYEPYPNIVDPTDRSSDNLDSLSVYQKYDLKQFSEVITIANAMENTASDTLNFYLAQSYLANNSFEEALKVLQSIESSSIFFEASQWYEGLILIRMDRAKEAKKLLDNIIENKSSYSSKANELKKQF